MGYVREIVESGLSVADRTAGTYVEKARAVAAARLTPEQTQKLESVVVDLCARAMPIVDEVDSRVDSTLASAVEIKEAQLQRAKDTVQYAQQQTEEKIQLARDAKADLQAKLQQTRELTEEKLQQARGMSKSELQAKLQETRELTEAKVLDTYKTAKAQAQETTGAKLQEVQTKLQEAKDTVKEQYEAKKELAREQYEAKKELAREQYEAKKELVQRTKADAEKRYTTGKEAVLSKVHETKAEVNAVVQDGTVTKLALVQLLLDRAEGTRFQHTATRLIEAADLVLKRSLVLPSALPRTLDEVKSCLPERLAMSVTRAQEFEEPLREKLEAAKTRAAELAGRASESYAGVREQASQSYAGVREQASQSYDGVREQASQSYDGVREQASGVYSTARGELEAKYAALQKTVAPHADTLQQRYEEVKTQIQSHAQSLVVTYSEPAQKALVIVFGKQAVTCGVEKAKPLLPAAVQEWMAEADGLD